ncbi:MAG: hypothetical protein ABL901_21260 [Hyphomicrobiaceae bacterium]
MNTRTLKIGALAAMSIVIASVAMAHPLPTAPAEPFNPDKFWTDQQQKGS